MRWQSTCRPRLKELPSILRAVPQKEIERMRRKLKCAQRYLWYAVSTASVRPALEAGRPMRLTR